MESTSSFCLNGSGEATGKYLIGDEGRSFEVGLDTNTAGVVPPLPTQDDDTNGYHSRSNGYACRDGNASLESDESDYYSDCSLGSLNSLYLNLKHKRPDLNITNGTNGTRSRNANSDTSETDRTTGMNVVAITTRITTNRKFYNRKNYEKPITKLNAFYFYGMQNTQYCYSRKSYVRQLKRKHPVASKIRTIRSSAAVYKYKRNVNKLRASLTKRKHRKCTMNKHLIRYRLKETIPLLKWNGRVKGNREHDSMQLTNPVEKSQQNEIEFVTGRETVSSEAGHYSGSERTAVDDHQSYGPDVFSTRDFADWTDDFEDALMIDDIVGRLFDEDRGDRPVGERAPDDGPTKRKTCTPISVRDFSPPVLL